MAAESDNPFAPPAYPAPSGPTVGGPVAAAPSWANLPPAPAATSAPPGAPVSQTRLADPNERSAVPVAPVAPLPAPLRVNRTARTAAILGALTLVLTPVAGIAAVALGRKAREEIARTGERGAGLATLGVRLGVGLSVAWLVAVAFFIALSAGSVAG